MSVLRGLTYLAIVLGITAYTFRAALVTPTPMVNDSHAVASLSIATNRVLCGTPSAISTDAHVGRLLLADPPLQLEPLSSVVVHRWGSVAAYCQTVTTALVNNENSLMLTEAAILTAAPNISLRAMSRVMLALKAAMIALLAFALLRSGAGVVMCLGVLQIGGTLLFELQRLSDMSVYPFLFCLMAMAIGIYGVAPGRRALGASGALLFIAGVASAYTANMRTSYLLLLLALFAGAAAVRVADEQAGRRLRAAMVLTLAFGAGYSLFHYWFIVRSRPPQATGMAYHVVAHPLVLSLGVEPNPLATREGIAWDDSRGLPLARRIDPSVRYLGPGYEDALFKYYFGLWKHYPREMIGVYVAKFRLAGSNVAARAQFATPNWWMTALVSLLQTFPSGFWFFALFLGGTAASVWGYVRTRAPIFVLAGMAALTALAMMTESAIINPMYAIQYHATFLMATGVVVLFAAQFLVSIAVWGIGAAVARR